MPVTVVEPNLEVLQKDRSELQAKRATLHREWQRQQRIIDPGLADRPPAGQADIWRARAQATRLEQQIADTIESLAQVDKHIKTAVAAKRGRLRPVFDKKLRRPPFIRGDKSGGRGKQSPQSGTRRSECRAPFLPGSAAMEWRVARRRRSERRGDMVVTLAKDRPTVALTGCRAGVQGCRAVRPLNCLRDPRGAPARGALRGEGGTARS